MRLDFASLFALPPPWQQLTALEARNWNTLPNSVLAS
jgi:hypothetical protein